MTPASSYLVEPEHRSEAFAELDGIQLAGSRKRKRMPPSL